MASHKNRKCITSTYMAIFEARKMSDIIPYIRIYLTCEM